MNLSKSKFKHRRLSDLSPEFQDFIMEMYAKRGWKVPEWVHCDIDNLKREMEKQPVEVQKYFDKHGIPPEKPREVTVR